MGLTHFTKATCDVCGTEQVFPLHSHEIRGHFVPVELPGMQDVPLDKLPWVCSAKCMIAFAQKEGETP